MIELQNLSAGYPGREVLHGLTLTAERGQVTVVAGPNGCGKSTLLKTLIRAVHATGGRVLIDGADWATLSSGELARKIAYLPQGKAVPDITAGRLTLHGRFPYLHYPRRYSKKDRALAEAAMERMGIRDLYDAPMQSLSGGTRQKVYIAMALCQDAPCILMDEPTTFLDVSHQLLLLDLAGELRKEGRCVVMVLHDLPMAMRAADKLVLLRDGSVLDSGEPEAVFLRGSLQKALGVRLARFRTDEGWQYYYQGRE